MGREVDSDFTPSDHQSVDGERFRSLFMHMVEGVAIHEIILDDSGRPINYKIVEVNPQYEKYTGLRPEKVVGKYATEAYGTEAPPYLSEYAEVALSGRPLRIETRFEPLQRDYEISVAPMGYGNFATIFSDVTERKRHEQVLRESEWFLKQSQRAGHLGSYRFNVAIGSWVNSPALDEVFGIDESYPRTTEGWIRLVHPEDAAAMGQYLADEVLSRGKTFDRRYRIVRPNDGAVRWVHGYGALELGADGRPQYMIGTIQDITESTHAEQALRAKTEELNHFFELTPDMLCITSKDRQLLRINAAWERILGWPLEELEGKRYVEFVHPDDIVATNQIQANLEQGIPAVDFTNRYRCRDGGYRWIEWRATPADDGNIYAAARDVTDWIGYEQAMRESEERYRLLVEASPFLVAIHDEGTIVFANRACVEMAGANSVDELVGRSLLDFLPEGFRPDSSDTSVGDVKTGAPTPTFERRFRRFDGEELAIEVTTVRFPYSGRTATLLVALDITERKRSGLERKRLEEQLQQAQKLESIGRLAGGVAHDFNNLLTVIMSCADSLSACELTSDEQQSDVRDIADAGRRAAELTRQLLAFSRQQVLQPSVIAPSGVVESASRLLRRLLGEDIELVVSASAKEDSVFADPGQLEQILVNLAVNARDAMPNGGRLTIETSTTHLKEELLPGESVVPGPYVMLTVADTGIGMDEATRLRAFDPFFTTKATQGTGLGLATVYGIVKQSGGHIWIQSQPGTGTRITICLPRIEEPPPPATSKRPPPLDRGTETILLVEDEEQVRRTIERVLVSAGYRVIVAADGEEALRRFETTCDTIHLLLTDVVMPKMTGRQLADRIVANEPSVRVLYMSGYTPDAIVHHGILDEGIDFIQKPLTPAVLLAKVGSILRS